MWSRGSGTQLTRCMLAECSPDVQMKTVVLVKPLAGCKVFLGGFGLWAPISYDGAVNQRSEREKKHQLVLINFHFWESAWQFPSELATCQCFSEIRRIRRCTSECLPIYRLVHKSTGKFFYWHIYGAKKRRTPSSASCVGLSIRNALWATFIEYLKTKS